MIDKLLLLACNLLVLANILPNDIIIKKYTILTFHRGYKGSICYSCKGLEAIKSISEDNVYKFPLSTLAICFDLRTSKQLMFLNLSP
jgi:hypothetical protein